ncbi:M56 family metallopeptidase [Candidatus Blastococcus massiliensis]|uniref:M56 family metallopeptidase n=1 Tax=Candidatus Blastococcus massiliensis TaxID=1470358 RepID=UPI0006854A6A|nr:M56 family metallopeptidase [Candidatus Blastococcus massiliensis]
MTALIALGAGTALVGWHGHRLLLRLGDLRLDPTILLTGWLLTTLGFVGSLLAAVSLAALPVDSHHAGTFDLAGHCWVALSSGTLPRAAEAIAAMGLASATLVLVRLALVVHARLRSRRRNAPHLHQLRLLAGDCRTTDPLWIQDDRPIALAIGGRSGLIVMSQALRDHLTPAAVHATLEHERAHLRGRHHLLLAVVETLAAALPWCPLLRAAPGATRDLVEMAADSRAARRCGPSAVREALSRLTSHAVPTGGLAMAGRLTEARLQRLTTGSVGANRYSRLAGCSAVAVGALMLPTAAAALVASVVQCAFV